MKMTKLKTVGLVAVMCSALLGCGPETPQSQPPAQKLESTNLLSDSYKIITDGNHYRWQFCDCITSDDFRTPGEAIYAANQDWLTIKKAVAEDKAEKARWHQVK